jgi:hypothetical protein
LHPAVLAAHRSAELDFHPRRLAGEVVGGRALQRRSVCRRDRQAIEKRCAPLEGRTRRDIEYFEEPRRGVMLVAGDVPIPERLVAHVHHTGVALLGFA